MINDESPKFPTGVVFIIFKYAEVSVILTLLCMYVCIMYVGRSLSKPSVEALRFLVSAVELITSYDKIILPV